jgi:CheY-like chemotaxis protein
MSRTEDLPSPQRSGLNVLVVEDNEDQATVEALLLATENHAVEIATDGPAAVRVVQEVKPDVVLLDIGLPGFDGYEVARRIHEMKLPKQPLLVAVTGRWEEEDLRRSRDAGIDVHLVKPVAPETLCVLLRQFHNVVH